MLVVHQVTGVWYHAQTGIESTIGWAPQLAAVAVATGNIPAADQLFAATGLESTIIRPGMLAALDLPGQPGLSAGIRPRRFSPLVWRSDEQR